MKTSGSTGRGALFAFSASEWSTMLAAALRRASLVAERLRGRKLSSISGGTGSNLGRVARNMSMGRGHVQHLSGMSNLPDLVDSLNGFQPYALRCFASIAALLAAEQSAGRLQIQPTVIITDLEVCTPAMRRRIHEAWGAEPYDTYGMVEVGTVGGDCRHHRGLHVLDDLFIYEVVDLDNQAVPAGQPGSKVLLTNLYSYTLPLIRLEVSDLVTMNPEPCRCGIPFPLLTMVEGRAAEILVLAANDGTDVHIHPNELALVMEKILEVREFQFVRSGDSLTVRVSRAEGASNDVLGERVLAAVSRHLRERGVVPVPTSVEFVDYFERDPACGAKHLIVVSTDPGPLLPT